MFSDEELIFQYDNVRTHPVKTIETYIDEKQQYLNTLRHEYCARRGVER